MLSRILSALIAALLLAGTAAPAIQPTDDGQPAAPIAAEPTAATALTQAEAEAIALAHAGFSRQEVTQLRTEKDYEQGVAEYDVEFRNGDWEYDYSIRIADGSIRKWEKEYDPVKPAPTQPAPQPTAPAPAPAQITADEAKSIALAHAGLTAAQVTGLRAEKDLDDGTWEFEVEFRVGNWEYEYEISAESGKILSWNKDWDD